MSLRARLSECLNREKETLAKNSKLSEMLKVCSKSLSFSPSWNRVWVNDTGLLKLISAKLGGKKINMFHFLTEK